MANKKEATRSTEVSPKLTVKAINSNIAAQIKTSRILPLTLMKKNINLESYFLNHLDYVAILGDTAKLLDRMVLHAIHESIVDIIKELLETSSSNIAGVWDNYTIYNICAADITIMQNSDTGELYLTYQPYASANTKEISEFPPHTMLKFSEYNPERFYTFRGYCAGHVIGVICSIITNSIPTLMCGSTGTTTPTLFYEKAKSIMGEASEVVDESRFSPTAPATEDSVKQLCNIIETRLLVGITQILESSGLSPNIIKLMLGTSRIHVLYDDPADHKLAEINVEIRVVSKVYNDLSPVSYHTTLANELMVIRDGVGMSKTRAEKYGRNFHSFVTSMSIFTINTYMAQIRLAKSNEESSE